MSATMTVERTRTVSLTVTPSVGVPAQLVVPRRRVAVVFSQQRGPRGPKGDTGSSTRPTRYDVVSPAATWTIAHALGYAPMAEVYDAAGNKVLVDIHVDATNVVVQFPQPVTGFVLAI